ncbi:MAG: fibronectin type III domain-containing protein [Nitrosomonas sp.]|uniref:fibronectin type III domain-containing protein n=1 Tax=Nitrosomonas sp. TaxID=42353 RepID=UPI0032EB4647
MKNKSLISAILIATLFGFPLNLVSAPSAPVITHSISGTSVTISWTNVPGASEYKLLYAPIPYTGPESIGSLDVGGVNSFSANLWEGASFYVAVQAGDNSGFSEYSNIGEITIATTVADLNGNWRVTQTWGPNNCGYTIGTKFEEDFFFTQSGNTVTALDGDLDDLSGNITGTTGSLLYSYEDEDTKESKTINFTILPGNTLSGSILWKYRDKEGGSIECILNTSFTAIKS